MVKEVNISETVLKEYSEKDIVHYLAKSLKQMSLSSRGADPTAMIVSYGAMVTDAARLSAIATALDKKMNKDTQDAKIML